MYDLILKKEVEWKAFWLHDPIMKKESVVQPIDAKRVKSFRTEKINIHSLFRKEFTLKDKPIKSALLYITADDCYKVYMNGEFIAFGPAQSFCTSYNYNAFEIKSLLKAGNNTFGAHVFYQGMLNMALLSADNLNGMICMLEVKYLDGEELLISSDKSFKCHNLKAYSFDKIYGYETAFSENIDLNLYPYGWLENSFDDSLWDTPFISAVPYPLSYKLQAQITPTVSFEKLYPKKIIKKGPGNYLLDFGTQVCGTTVIKAKGDKDHVIRVWHAEELVEGENKARHNMRCGCDYDETITLTGLDDFAEFYDFKGFRFVELIDYPNDLEAEKENVYVMHRHYPIPHNHGSFQSDHELFNKIWTICERGITEGTQEAYIDCPTREKGAFLGDGLITGLSHLAYTNDTRIMKKFLIDCINSAKMCPSLFSTAITYDATQLIDYSLIFPMVLNLYYKFTNDKKILEDSYIILGGILDYYADFYRDRGILEELRLVHRDDQPAVLVDWPVAYRDGYNPENLLATNSFGNLMYLALLKETAQTYNYLNLEDEANKLLEEAKLLEKGIIDVFYDHETGFLRITEDSDVINFHNQVMALYLEMDLPKGKKILFDYILEREIACGVYFTYYYFAVLLREKLYDKVFELMTSNKRSSWKTMIDVGATSCLEAWHPDDKINCSMCHPWSSTPMIMTDLFMGFTYKDFGFETALFKPRIPLQLNKGTYKKPTPLSDVEITFERKDNKIYYKLKIKKSFKLYVDLYDQKPGYYIDVTPGIHEFIQELD